MKQRIFTLRQIIEEGTAVLEAAGIEEAEAALNAWYLLEYTAGVSRAAYYGNPDRVMEEKQAEKYLETVAVRAKRVPLQHITGEQEFMGYPFYVNAHVLIPRQDTETLVEEAVKVIRRMRRRDRTEAERLQSRTEAEGRKSGAETEGLQRRTKAERLQRRTKAEALQSRMETEGLQSQMETCGRQSGTEANGLQGSGGKQRREACGLQSSGQEQWREACGFQRSGEDVLHVLDLCTGSGCILLSLMKQCPDIRGVGCDISEETLEVARRNAKRLGVSADWHRADLFEDLDGIYDLIVSNPPYIPTADIEGLQEEVRFHDPRIALDGGKDGLHFYRRIIEESASYMKDGGSLLFEIGHDQGEAVSELMKNHGYEHVAVKKDLSGLDRVVTGIYSGRGSCEDRY